MKDSQAKLTYAIKNGLMVHVDNVDTGNACECICPHCHGKLCAKNTSDDIVHHFAHISGKQCDGAYESAMHQLAKEILAETKWLRLPNKRILSFKEVRLEQTDSKTGLRPDCIGINNGKETWIEFAYTHKAEPEKITSIVSNKIECIEIDISECSLNKQNIEDFIENSPSNRMWLYSNKYPIGNTEQPSSNVHARGEGRHCAINSNGDLIDISKMDIVRRYDFNLNPCRCLVCGKPLLLSMDKFGGYQFTHQGEHPECEDENYWSELAKQVFYNRIKRDHYLELFLPIREYCSEYNQCQFRSVKYCHDFKKHSFKLKQEKIEFEELPTILNAKVDNLKDIIIIKANSKIRFIFNINPHAVSKNSNEKEIELRVWNEKQALDIDTLTFDSDEPYVYFRNFEWQKKKDEKKQCNVFLAFSTKRYAVETIECPNKPLHRWENSKSVVKRIYFDNEIEKEEAIPYGILDCLKNDLNGEFCPCPCLLCQSFQEHNEICLKSLKYGTPQYPLDCKEPDSYPISCELFKIRDEYKNMDVSDYIRRKD